jgi:hypothetical protein
MKMAICLIILLSLLVFSFGCNKNTESSTAGYKTYKMGLDNLSLKWCNHPLFSVEYPKELTLIDYNSNPQAVIFYNSADTTFFNPKGFGSLISQLEINISRPVKSRYMNSTEKLSEIISDSSLFGNNVTISKVNISGIDASYFDSLSNAIKGKLQEIHRVVIFDYAGLIWQITMITNSLYPEPLEVQDTFEHVLTTFKIKDTFCNNIHHDNTLNMNISYDYSKGVFIIISNEDLTLCNVNLYLNFTGDDLSSGFEYSQNNGITSHQVIEIQDWLFEDKDNNNFRYSLNKHVSKLLIQAEFPGCNKTYTFLKTWD